MQIDQNSGALLGDPLERASNHALALALHRSKHVAIDAMRMHAHQHVFAPGDLAVNQRQVHFRDDGAGVDDALEIAELGAQATLRLAADDTLILQAIADQVGHRDHLEFVLEAELAKLRDAGHGAVVVHDFADDTAGPESGQTREIHHSLGLAGAHQYSAFASAQRENMTRPDQVARLGGGTHGGRNGMGAVGGRDYRGDALGGFNVVGWRRAPLPLQAKASGCRMSYSDAGKQYNHERHAQGVHRRAGWQLLRLWDANLPGFGR